MFRNSYAGLRCDKEGNACKAIGGKTQKTPFTSVDGRITYALQPEDDFPLRNGYNVQFFVKAYRKGDPGLGGIYGSRLVQVATKSP
jgi:hypothetical protein